MTSALEAVSTLADARPRTIAISEPSIAESEIEAVCAVLRSGQLAQGTTVAELEAAFADYVGARYAVATSSGTTALHLALLAHGVGPGDEVITTPFTFIATANAILFCGALPVFVDVDPETLNLSPRAVQAAITERTRAILPVHLYGNPCDILALEKIAAETGLALVEDACQAHGARAHGRRVGSFGTGCFSFYPTKNMTCGEGGMITTSNSTIAERAVCLRNHGRQGTSYQHEELGFNARMTDVHAAIGLGQLARLDGLNERRRANAAFYDAELHDVRRPAIPTGAQSVWHQYTLLLPPDQRDAIVEELRRRGVGAAVYYPIPLHRQPVYLARGVKAECPRADLAAASVCSIPVHPGLTESDRTYVASQVRDVLARA